MFCAVIFDWDGTLANSRDAVVASFQKIFKEAGIAVSDEFVEKRIGIGSRNVIRDSLKASNITYDDRLLEELRSKKIEAEMALAAKVKLFDGAKDLLDCLSGRIAMVLATMNDRAIINDLLEKKEIGKYFKVVIAADEVAKPKPDPEIFLTAAARLKCNPRECVVLEDSIFGVKAAKAASMNCIAVSTGVYSIAELQSENPDLIVRSLKERERILSFIFG